MYTYPYNLLNFYHTINHFRPRNPKRKPCRYSTPVSSKIKRLYNRKLTNSNPYVNLEIMKKTKMSICWWKMKKSGNSWAFIVKKCVNNWKICFLILKTVFFLQFQETSKQLDSCTNDLQIKREENDHFRKLLLEKDSQVDFCKSFSLSQCKPEIFSHFELITNWPRISWKIWQEVIRI